MSGRTHWRARTRPPRGERTEFRRTCESEEIAPFLSDAAHYPGGAASEVCFPTNEAEVAAILAEGRPVLVAAAQSSLTGGATPRGETVISVSCLNRAQFVGAGTDAGLRVTVGAGVVLRELCEALDARGMYYPPVPTFDGATVGGTVATNAAGAATFKYGTTRDWVTGLTVVLAAGDVLELERGQVRAHRDGFFEIERAAGGLTRVVLPEIRMPDVPKTSAGYFTAPGMDLVDLFIGSEGTLGIVTEVRLRVVGRRPDWFVAWVPVADDRGAVELAGALRRVASIGGGVDVAAVEYVDRRSLELARHAGAFERAGFGLPADCGAAVLLQAELPAGTSTARARDEIAAIDNAAADTPLLRICRLLRERGLFERAVPALPGESAKRASLFVLREAVPEALNDVVRDRQRTVDASISKAAADVIVPFSRFGESLARYRRIADCYGLDMAVWGHISDGNVHPNFLVADGAQMRAARAALLELGRAAIEMGGSPMSEHGVGRNEVKKQLLLSLYGETGVIGMKQVKNALDPHGHLAPGVLF